MNIINSNISLLQQITNYPIISISNRHKLHNIKLQKQNILVFGDQITGIIKK